LFLACTEPCFKEGDCTCTQRHCVCFGESGSQRDRSSNCLECLLGRYVVSLFCAQKWIKDLALVMFNYHGCRVVCQFFVSCWLPIVVLTGTIKIWDTREHNVSPRCVVLLLCLLCVCGLCFAMENTHVRACFGNCFSFRTIRASKPYLPNPLILSPLLLWPLCQIDCGVPLRGHFICGICKRIC
jgi:hypothetical protein